MESPDPIRASERRERAFARAVSAYERARLLSALRASWPAVVVVVVALALGRPAPVGAALVAAVVALHVVGLGWARGVRTGLAWGVLPFIASVVAQESHGCAGATCGPCGLPWVVGCAVAGVVAGGVCGWQGRREPARAASSVLVAALVGALGCVAVGAAAVFGTAAALVVAGAVPVLVALRARA